MFDETEIRFIDAAPIGHNQPPDPLDPAMIEAQLAEDHAALVKRREQLVQAADAFLERVPEITDVDQESAAAENLRLFSVFVRQAEDRRKQAKEPYLEGGKAVDRWFQGIRAPIAAAQETFEALLRPWAQRLERQRREEAQREAEEARRRAEAAEREARESGDYDAAIQAARNAAAAALHAMAPAAAHSRMEGTYGAVASLRSQWTYEITDEAGIPRDYLKVDEAAIRAAIKRGVREIAGLRIFQQQKVQAR